MFAAKMRGGEGIVGYEYMSDTNEIDVTRAVFRCKARRQILGQRTVCLQVDFDVVYRWNDRMDQMRVSH